MANFKHSIRFYLQQAKDKSKETPLRCFVLYDNRQAVFSTGQSIEPRYWNPKERKPRQSVAINWQKIDRELDNIADWTKIGRAHVWTPVTNAHLVCRLLLEKKKHNNRYRQLNHNTRLNKHKTIE